MSNIFETLMAQTDIDPIQTEKILMVGNDDYQHLTDDLTEQIEGIELGLEAMQDLNNIEALYKSDKSNVTQRIANIAVEDIKKKLGIFNSETIISTEAFDGKSNGGFTELLRTIWQAIVRTFRAIWNTITGLFKRRGSEQQKEKVEHVIEKVKESPVDKHKKVELSNVATSTIPSGVSPAVIAETGYSEEIRGFEFINKQLRVHDLIKNMENVGTVYGKLENMMHRIVTASAALEDVVRALPSELPDGEFGSEIKKLINTAILTYVSIPNHGLTIADDLHRHREEFQHKTGISFNSVETGSVFKQDGFIGDQQYYMYATSFGGDLAGIEESVRWRTFVSNRAGGNAKLVCVNADEFEKYGAAFIKVSDNNSKVLDAFESTSKGVHTIQDRTVQTLGSKDSRFDTSMSSKEFMAVKHITSIVKNFLETISHMYRLESLCDQTMRAHAAIVLSVGKQYH